MSPAAPVVSDKPTTYAPLGRGESQHAAPGTACALLATCARVFEQRPAAEVTSMQGVHRLCIKPGQFPEVGHGGVGTRYVTVCREPSSLI